MTLHEWAIKHRVTHVALEELDQMFRLEGYMPFREVIDGSEAQVQRDCRLEASKKGHRLWRNNVGAGKLENGSFLRWGLANESAAVNHIMKSSDLIGIRKDGVFMAREVKPIGWRYTGTEREVAQLNFIKLVVAMGGDACFASGGETMV